MNAEKNLKYLNRKKKMKKSVSFRTTFFRYSKSRFIRGSCQSSSVRFGVGNISPKVGVDPKKFRFKNKITKQPKPIQNFNTKVHKNNIILKNLKPLIFWSLSVRTDSSF